MQFGKLLKLPYLNPMTKCGANLFILPPQILWSLYLARGAYSSNFMILENVKILQINAFLQAIKKWSNCNNMNKWESKQIILEHKFMVEFPHGMGSLQEYLQNL